MQSLRFHFPYDPQNKNQLTQLRRGRVCRLSIIGFFDKNVTQNMIPNCKNVKMLNFYTNFFSL